MAAREIVDAHVHVWSSDTGQFPYAPGFGPQDLWSPSFDETELIERAEPAGVTRFNLVQMTWYGLDHSYILKLIHSHPQRFAGTGIVTALTDVGLPDPDRAMQALAEQGIRAFRVRGFSSRPAGLEGDHWLDHPSFNAMFRMSAAQNLPLSFLCSPSDFREISRMCGQHPDAPVIIDHVGMLGTARHSTDAEIDALAKLAQHPRTMVKLSAYGALSKEGPPYLDVLPIVRRVLDAFGPDRCMWASDSPGQTTPPHSYEASIALLAEHARFLSESDVDKLLHGTAKHVFWPS